MGRLSPLDIDIPDTEILIITCSICVILNVIFEKIFIIKAITKTIASLCFVLVSINQGILLQSSNFYYGIFGGLVFGAFGDIFLLSSGTGFMFLLGLISFLLGHLFYIFAFFYIPFDNNWLFMGFIVMSIRSLFIWKSLTNPSNSKKMHGIDVIGYIIVITFMVTISIANVGFVFTQFGSLQDAWIHSPFTLLRFLGAELFYYSDICVAKQRFGTKTPINRIIGLPLYYIAQLLIAYCI